MRRRHLLVPAVVVAVAVSAAAAGAAWLSSGTGSSSSRSTNVEKPTAVAATATGTTSIQVTWSAPASGPAPVSYDVFRYSGATGTKVCGPVLAASPRVCNDTGLSPGTTYGYTVESRLGTNWMSGQATQVDATTNAAPVGTPNFLVELATAGNKTAGTPFDLRVTARNGTTTDATYTGSHNLTFSGPGQNAGFAAPTYPTSGTFTAGVATVPVTLRKAETATLTVAEGARTGNTSVTVVPGAVGLRWTNSNTSCSNGSVTVGNGGTFTSSVSRLDSSGNVVTTTGQVNVTLSRSPNQGTLSTTSLTIANGATQSGGQVSLTTGSPPEITLTASASGFTSLTCLVKK